MMALADLAQQLDIKREISFDGKVKLLLSQEQQEGRQSRDWNADIQAWAQTEITGRTKDEKAPQRLEKAKLQALILEAQSQRLKYLVSEEDIVFSVERAKEAYNLYRAGFTALLGDDENNEKFNAKGPLQEFISKVFTDWGPWGAQQENRAMKGIQRIRRQEVVFNVEKDIRHFLLDEILREYTESNNGLSTKESSRRREVRTFIEENRKALVDGNDAIMRAAVGLINSIDCTAEVAFRNYNPYASWQSYEPRLTSYHLPATDTNADGKPIALYVKGVSLEPYDVGSEEEKIFFRALAAACFASIFLEEDQEKQTLLKGLFLTALKDVRRGHNLGGQAVGDVAKDDVVDALLCGSGITAIFRQFCMAHTVKKFKVTAPDFEIVDEVLTSYLLEQFSLAIKRIKNPKNKIYFSRALTLFSKEGIFEVGQEIDGFLELMPEHPAGSEEAGELANLGKGIDLVAKFCAEYFPAGSARECVFANVQNQYIDLALEKMRPAFDVLYLQYSAGCFEVAASKLDEQYQVEMKSGFRQAILEQDLQLLKEYLDVIDLDMTQIDVNEKIETVDKKFMTPLEYAVTVGGNVGVVRLLCDSKDVCEISADIADRALNEEVKAVLIEKAPLVAERAKQKEAEERIIKEKAMADQLKYESMRQKREQLLRENLQKDLIDALENNNVSSLIDLIKQDSNFLDFNGVIAYQGQNMPLLVYAITAHSDNFKLIAALAKAPKIERNTPEVEAALKNASEIVRAIIRTPFLFNISNEKQMLDPAQAEENPLGEHPPRPAYSLVGRLLIYIVRFLTRVLSAIGFSGPEDAFNRRYPEEIEPSIPHVTEGSGNDGNQAEDPVPVRAIILSREARAALAAAGIVYGRSVGPVSEPSNSPRPI